MQHLRPLEVQEHPFIHGGKCAFGDIHHRVLIGVTADRGVEGVPDDCHSITRLIVVHGVQDCHLILRPDNFREGGKIETDVFLGLDLFLYYKC